MKMPLGGMGMGAKPVPPNRADLEKVVARAKAGSAADNKKTQALIAKADRSKAFWFAGSAAGTPAADSVTEGTAWFDTSKTAMKFGFAVTLTDPQMASMAVTKFKEIPDALAMLPPDIQGVAKDFFKSAKLSSSGGTLKGSFVVENELLEKVGPLMKQMGGGF